MSENLLPPGGPNLRQEDRRRWAIIWFNQLIRFHEVQDVKTWKFGQDEVIHYLKSKQRSGMPAWKRLKIAEGLSLYSELHPGAMGGSLKYVLDKLAEVVAEVFWFSGKPGVAEGRLRLCLRPTR